MFELLLGTKKIKIFREQTVIVCFSKLLQKFGRCLTVRQKQIGGNRLLSGMFGR